MTIASYRDPTLPVAARVDDLLTRMTLDEKAALMFQPAIVVGEDGELSEGEPGLGVASAAHTIDEVGITHYNLIGSADDVRSLARWHNLLQRSAASTRLGIPVTVSTDPRHHFTDNPATATPAGAFSLWPELIGLAALRSPARVQEFADIARQEYIAVGLRVALHPQIDLATEPRWARINNTFGEDADLTGELGAAYVRGLQGATLGPSSVAAMLKHFPGGGPQKDGEDPHFPYGREQVYSTPESFEYHLRPFRPALAAGASQVMPYYGMPVATEYGERGFAFDRGVVTDLLRGELGFTGIVCTDWGILTDSVMMGEPVVARAWGVEHLTPLERAELALDAGCDQFGGESDVTLVTQLVRSGRVSEARIDESARRLLTEKFTLGLFDNPFVDEEQAAAVVGSPAFRERGDAAQRDSITLLTNREDVLPLARSVRLYVENVDPGLAARYATIVTSPEEADVALIRVKAPFERRSGFFESLFHTGSLEFPDDVRARHADLLNAVPTVVDIYLDRPAVVPELSMHAAALIANYGSEDAALLDVVFGRSQPLGALPFDLPSSMAAVLASKEDLPFDTKDPLFQFGHGLRFTRAGDSSPLLPETVRPDEEVVTAEPLEAARLVGTWTVTVRTPRGEMPLELVLREGGDSLAGELAGRPISDVSISDNELSFKAALSNPFPVNIRVRATVAGATMSGSAKPSMFATSLPLTGQRTSPHVTGATPR